jgi:hypothetical protein
MISVTRCFFPIGSCLQNISLAGAERTVVRMGIFGDIAVTERVMRETRKPIQHVRLIDLLFAISYSGSRLGLRSCHPFRQICGWFEDPCR